MHSVIRFLDITQTQIDDIAKDINQLLPGFCAEIKPCVRNANQFSFDISQKSDWQEHEKDILNTLKVIKPAIIRAYKRSPSLEVHLDTAIHLIDYESRFVTEVYWGMELLATLLKCKIIPMFSIYHIQYYDHILDNKE